jgi:hypothetical protein
MMAQQNIDLRLDRQRFSQEMFRRANQHNWIIDPVSDSGLLDSLSRLFEERVSDRWFIVDFAPDHMLDAFLKQADNDRNINILYVFSPGGPTYDDDIWTLYNGWMINRISPADLQVLFRKLKLA